MTSTELAYVYAALILNEDNIQISNEKILSILNAAGINVESYWVDLFDEYFNSHDIIELIKGTTLDNNSQNSVQSDQNKTKENDENKKSQKEEEEEVEFECGFEDLFN